MTNFVQKVRNFLTSEDGPTAVEYAVMLALILVACIVVVTQLGENINTTFTDIDTRMTAANGGGS